MSKTNKQKKVVIAMSGGVDSSVAAALLRKQGFDVIGVFMKFWREPLKNKLTGKWNRCCSLEAEKKAREVAAILDIPFYVFDFKKEFKKTVVDYFIKEYKEGKTPNPCVICNKKIKFGLLLEKALSLNADFVATGHYARLHRYACPKLLHCCGRAKHCGQARVSPANTEKTRKIPSYKLFRGKDKTKDQSYFLWQLNQKQLKRILFPVGNYTKVQVRDLAKKFNLPVLDIPESQEICFIQTTLNDFLTRRIKSKPGSITTIEGEKIGQHKGLPFYTIGQRKGIELSGGPFYVTNKNLKQNALIVAPFSNKNLYKKTLIAKNINWTSGQEPKLPLKINAQIRYGHKAVQAIITKKLQPARIATPARSRYSVSGGQSVAGGTTSYKLIFGTRQRAITPGQSVVFYQGQEVAGGGIIC
ncbi:tRNA 2-thiouridine(34) synthase MnmA [Patescibacteria group bacterium]|nr:tRNA 2-thiouridine(34) synthase MnmA [Patescibacteria group bacterium]